MKCAESYGIGKYVYMYPAQPYERMPIFINSCDLVLAPVKKMLKNFATPLKIAEALACGVPVVTTNISEFKLWYRRGVYTYTTQAEVEDLVRRQVCGGEAREERARRDCVLRRAEH
jgi:glycosyltransferase involved in cell wall biosynthesis